MVSSTDLKSTRASSNEEELKKNHNVQHLHCSGAHLQNHTKGFCFLRVESNIDFRYKDSYCGVIYSWVNLKTPVFMKKGFILNMINILNGILQKDQLMTRIVC